MMTCQAAVVLGALVMGVVFGGCATQANHPSAIAAMDGASMSARETDGYGIPAGNSFQSGSAARPRLGDYVEHAELRDIHFDFDSYEIGLTEAQALEMSVQWLRRNPDAQLLIEGHTDERGTNEYNVVLGERRAKASKNYLMSHGIAASRITVISYGEERGLCHEKTEGCWTQNRRAHFLVKSR